MLSQQVIALYFSVPQCLEGLKVLVKSLFGATFHSMPFAPGESWHPDVMKLSLHHPEEVTFNFIMNGLRVCVVFITLPYDYMLGLTASSDYSENLVSTRITHAEFKALVF